MLCKEYCVNMPYKAVSLTNPVADAGRLVRRAGAAAGALMVGRMRMRARQGAGQSASKTVIVRKKRQETGSDQHDYRKSNVTYGRKPRVTVRNLNRLVKANLERTDLVINRTSAFGGLSGVDTLQNTQTALGAQLTVPCILYDMTSSPNVINNTVTQPFTCWTVNFSNETDSANLVWQENAARRWAVNQATEVFNGTGIYPQGQSQLEHINARFIFYAPTALPTRIQVELIQLKDQRLHPTQAAGGSTVTDSFATAFWQYMTKPFAFSQIERQNPQYKRFYRVLQRKTIYMDPKETTESSSTRYAELNMFMKLYRKCNYRWQHSDKVGMVGADTQLTFDTANNTTVHPNARLYLMVRGISGRVVGGGGYSATANPSFDSYFRAVHTVAP